MCTDTRPTLSQLHILKSQSGNVKIIKRLTPLWKTFGALLNFDSNGAKLRDIEHEYPNDPESCCREVLQHWLVGNGVEPCSWRKLVEIIDDSDQEILAEEIMAALSGHK